MTTRPGSEGRSASVVDLFPTKHLEAPKVREMPSPPSNFRRIIGSGIIAAGVGMASGEFILYPYIASQVELIFVWAALVGLATQYFLNMEIERYTLATGETALTGFSRYWRHWGLFFAIEASTKQIRPRPGRVAALVWSFLLFGVLTVLTFNQQIQDLLD